MRVIRKLFRTPAPHHWRCQTCGEPIGEGGGVIEIVNADPELGTVGGFPRRHQEVEPTDIVTTFARGPRLAFWVYHMDTCDPVPDRDVEGYWIPAAGAQTLEAWIAWVVHVSRKSWITPTELMGLLEFWWTHKGERPPTPGTH